jgi:hypothetical protein
MLITRCCKCISDGLTAVASSENRRRVAVYVEQQQQQQHRRASEGLYSQAYYSLHALFCYMCIPWETEHVQ